MMRCANSAARNDETLTAINGYTGMSDGKVYDEASEVSAEDGEVIVKGPDAVDVSLTPEAAETTSDRLLTGSLKARGQKHFKTNPPFRTSDKR